MHRGLHCAGEQYLALRRNPGSPEGRLRRAPAAIDGQRRRFAAPPHPKLAVEAAADELGEAYEKRWRLGGVLLAKTFADLARRLPPLRSAKTQSRLGDFPPPIDAADGKGSQSARTHHPSTLRTP